MRSIHRCYLIAWWLQYQFLVEAFLLNVPNRPQADSRTRGTHPQQLAALDSLISPSETQETSSITPEKDKHASSTKSEGEEINKEIQRLCDAQAIDDAIKVLDDLERSVANGIDTRGLPNEQSYSLILHALANRDDSSTPDLGEKIFKRMTDFSEMHPGYFSPTVDSYDALIHLWSKPFRVKKAGARCDELLDELWSLYKATQNTKDHLPLKSMYISTMTAWARSGRGVEGAKRAQERLEEMDSLRDQYPSLAPSTICANIVLNAWSKSSSRIGADRCISILNEMEAIYLSGRTEMQPNTTSFNNVLFALANSRIRDSERQAEALLERMDKFSTEHSDVRDTCSPDKISFNIVLNAWARSRNPSAAHRADAILRHMEQRHATNETDIEPDVTSYTTVLNAWAKSRDRNAAQQAEELLQRMEEAYQNGNVEARPNAMSYNTLINVWSKSKLPEAVDRAFQTLELMKDLSSQQGRENCAPDVFTYTSLIDTLSKQKNSDADKRAESILEELENSYEESMDEKLKPNIRTYTSVINAIGRSGRDPERAYALVNKLETQFKSGDNSVQPDVVCYNALLNAYGWSKGKGKAEKCYEIYKHMLELYNSGENKAAKPDIITCNSLLNACAFEEAQTDTERAKVVDIVVNTLDEFSSSAPTFGFPNHISYGTVLLAISKLMVSGSETRNKLAEATFWQCCQNGQVNQLVVIHLHQALTWEKFEALLGPALDSKKGEKLSFDLDVFPDEWRNHAPRPKQKRGSAPSRKSRTGNAITKSAIQEKQIRALQT